MSLFGSLYSSVSGIQAQGTAIGIISDNVSNQSTVGYKAGSQYFGTLVTNSGSTVAYSPGGVRAQNRQLISQQGLLQTTSSPLDIAISGNGFFVVQDSLNASDNPTTSFTRAGSFQTDLLGNFVNGAGLYLMAWPLDENGAIPGNSASLSTLEVVNIGSASGDATATTKVNVGIKLDSTKSIFKGAGDIANPGSDNINLENRDNFGSTILVPNANLIQGDAMSIEIDGQYSYNFTYDGFATSGDIAGAGAGNGPFFGSANAESPFQASPGVLAAGDTFTIARSSDPTNPLTFKFVTTSPKAADGEFNSLETLARAINDATGLTARVAEVGGEVRLYVAADDASEGLTFAAGSGAVADIPAVLGLTTFAADNSNNRFNTLEGLSTLINEATSDRVLSEVTDTGNKNAAVNITSKDPLTTIQFANATGTSDFLAEFGLLGTTIPASYDATLNTKNMASGAITPTFSRALDIYDSLGVAHNVTIGFLKVAENNWKVEIYAKDGERQLAGNQIAAGSLEFNTDGTLRSIDAELTSIDGFRWSNEADSPDLTFDFGTYGETNGLSQFAGNENVKFLTKNGSAAGLLDSVSIDKNGYVIANFNNGQTQRLYKIPLADFANPNGLINRNGNTFMQSYESGEVNLKEAATGGVGSIAPSSLEGANTELSEELTDLIVAQRAYQANTKVITTASDLLDVLNRVGQ